MRVRLSRRTIRWLVTLVISLVVLYVWPYVQAKLNSTPAVQPGWYFVSEVYDGDTIGVMMNGQLERIRMIGVDTPETHDPDTPAQCYGEHATTATKEKLHRKSVRLEADATNDNRDRYGRLLRYVYSEDNVLWNHELIKRGEGFAYISFPFIHKAVFQASQFEAAREKKGLWGVCQTSQKNGRWQTNSLQ